MSNDQFEWDVIIPKKSFWRATAIRAIFLVPATVGSTYGLYRFAFSQPYVKSDELFVFLLVCLLGVVGLLNFIIHQIVSSLPPKLIHYQLNEQGITKNNQTIPLSALKSAEIINVLKQSVLPQSEWRKPRPVDRKSLSLNLNSTQGMLTLEFSKEDARQQFIDKFLQYQLPTQ